MVCLALGAGRADERHVLYDQAVSVCHEEQGGGGEEEEGGINYRLFFGYGCFLSKMSRLCVLVLCALLLSVGFAIDSFFGVPDHERRRYEQSVRSRCYPDT